MKKGDWVYCEALGKAGLVREVIDTRTKDDIDVRFVIVAFPSPSVQYAYGSTKMESTRRRPVEVLRLKSGALTLITNDKKPVMFPVGLGITAESRRFYVKVFGTQQQKAALRAWGEAKSIVNQLRAAL
jgi:hypothetical protein